MAGQIFLLFSADYELYFGENFFSEREVLIQPTEGLLKGCEEEGIPMTLFADVTSVWRYRSLGIRSEYPSLFEDQLRRAISSMHDVQLHLHPHWMTSEFDGERWHMDGTKFKLSDVGYRREGTRGSESAEELIVRGKNYLENLLWPEKPSYECLAFRAGGYGLQPRDRELFGALLSAGFMIDSSIAPGLVYKSNVNEIDFRYLPANVNARFGPRYGLAEEDSSGIFEIPIAAYRESFGETFIRRLSSTTSILTEIKTKVTRNFYGEFMPRGRGIQTDNLLKRAARRILHPSIFQLEMSGPIDLERLISGTSKFIQCHLPKSNDLFFSALCHPKDVFPTNTKAIRRFWTAMKKSYGSKIMAITFQEAARKLEERS